MQRYDFFLIRCFFLWKMWKIGGRKVGDRWAKRGTKKRNGARNEEKIWYVEKKLYLCKLKMV